MGENDGASRRFQLIGMKTSILEPGLELALGLAVPRGTHGDIVSGGKDMGSIATACPARQREAGRKHRRVFAGHMGCMLRGILSTERVAIFLLFNMHFYLISWVERLLSVHPTSS